MCKSFGASDDLAQELVQEMYVRLYKYVDDAVTYVVIYSKPEPVGTGNCVVVNGKLYKLPEGVKPDCHILVNPGDISKTE